MCSSPNTNKFRGALDVLRRGRDMMVEELADAVNDRAEDLLESPFLLTELLEHHGMKLQLLALMMGQLEQLADDQGSETSFSDDAVFPPAEGDAPCLPKRRKRRRGRKRRKLNRASSAKQTSDGFDR